MVINVEKLRKIGVAVRIFQDNGDGIAKEVKHLTGAFIEIHHENGERHLPKELTDALREMVHTKVYADAILENLSVRVHAVQIMEAIEASNNEED